MSGCAGCGMPLDDWTPGCKACVARDYKRAVRSGDPDLLARHHMIGRRNLELGVQEHTRRQRDGESPSAGTWLPRDDGGRWVSVTS